MPCVLPEYVFFWVDSQWEGHWCTADKNPQCPNEAIFRIKYTMKPLKASTMMLASPRYDPRSITLNPVVKVQFFIPSSRDTNIPNFFFSSVFPLEHILSLFPAQKGHENQILLGLWNANSEICDSEEGHSLKEYTLTVASHSNGQQKIVSILNDDEQDTPSVQTHKSFLTIADWIERTLNQLYPDEKTSFKYLRTFCRGPWTDVFFFDLHKLYEGEDQTTNLPPILALYILCNAILEHGLTPQIVHELLLRRGIRTKRDVKLFLAIMRDVLMCFTICLKEGKYRDDFCLKKLVEDQPFSFSFKMKGMGDDNVFEEDDCEGRNQQGCIHIKNLFCCFARDFHSKFGGENIRRQLHQAQSCLRVSETTMNYLLDIAVMIGDMFMEERLMAHMCVGDCISKRFDGLIQEEGAEEADGHSFGILLYNDVTTGLQGSVILETTGYEGCESDTQVDETITQYKERDMNTLLSLLTKDISSLGIKLKMSPTKEDHFYVKVFVGNDALFFTYHPPQRDGEHGFITYGARPSLLDQKFVKYNGETIEQATWCHCAILVTPLQWLESLSTGKGLWPKVKGAREILRLYSRLQSMYPSFHQCLKPPQDSEEEFLRRINQYWGCIDEQHIRNSYGVRKDIVFMTRADRPLPAIVKKWISSQNHNKHNKKRVISSHPFMQSHVFHIKYQEPILGFEWEA